MITIIKKNVLTFQVNKYCREQKIKSRIFDIEVYNEWLVNLDMVQSKVQFINIRDGINPGDTIIVEGNYNLAHDSKVKIVR